MNPKIESPKTVLRGVLRVRDGKTGEVKVERPFVAEAVMGGGRDPSKMMPTLKPQVKP